jgi:hypothetical protein
VSRSWGGVFLHIDAAAQSYESQRKQQYVAHRVFPCVMEMRPKFDVPHSLESASGSMKPSPLGRQTSRCRPLRCCSGQGEYPITTSTTDQKNRTAAVSFATTPWSELVTAAPTPEMRPQAHRRASADGAVHVRSGEVRSGLEVMSQRDMRDPWWVPAPLEWPSMTKPFKVALAASRPIWTLTPRSSHWSAPPPTISLPPAIMS